MYRILTAVTLCFALASAQTDNEIIPAAIAADGNKDTGSSSATATATTTYLGNIKLPPGAVAMIPQTESSDSQLYVPTSTTTPTPQEPASFSYEPDTTTEYEPSSSIFYYAPTTTSTAVEQPVYSQSSSYADYSSPLAPDVVRTESSDSNLAMPTPSSSQQYYYPPPQPTTESPPPPPVFTYAPTTPYESPAQTTPIVYAPSSKNEPYPPASNSSAPIPVAPIPVTEGSASFAVGSETIRLGNTATVNNTPIVIQTNSFDNTEIQVGTEKPSMIAYHSTKAVANLAAAAAAAAPTTPAPTPSVSKSTVYVQPAPVSQPGTLTSKIVPVYSTAEPQTTDEPLTYDHNTPEPSSTEHVMTYKGHTISLGPATLAAEPTGWMPEGGRASPAGSASEGAGVRVGGSGSGVVCVVVAMAAGMGALLV